MDNEKIERFVAAADSLVNLLATDPQPRPSARRLHATLVTKAYDEYDAAREAVTGEELVPETDE